MPGITDIEAAVVLAEAETGARGGKSKLRVCVRSLPSKGRNWTVDEKDFLIKNHARISLEEMARRLNRTPIAVRLHVQRELHLRSCSTNESVVTAEQIAWGIGTDSKSVHRLMNKGLMPGRRAPTQYRSIRIADKLVLLKWLLDPSHWIYFKPMRVGMLSRGCNRSPSKYYDFAFWDGARDLIVPAFKKWKDQWLTPVQAAKKIGIIIHQHKDSTTPPRPSHYINVAIHKGNLKATRWGNWWILKSDLPRRGKVINYCGEIVERK